MLSKALFKVDDVKTSLAVATIQTQSSVSSKIAKVLKYRNIYFLWNSSKNSFQNFLKLHKKTSTSSTPINVVLFLFGLLKMSPT